MPHTITAEAHSRRHSSGTDSLSASSIHTLKHTDFTSPAGLHLANQSFSQAAPLTAIAQGQASSRGQPQASADGHAHVRQRSSQASATHHRRHSSFSRPLSYEKRPKQRTPSPRKRSGTDASNNSSYHQPQTPSASTMPSTLPHQDPQHLPDFKSRYAYGYHSEDQPHALAPNTSTPRTAVKMPSATDPGEQRATAATTRRPHTAHSQQSNGSKDPASSPSRRKSRREKDKKSKLANALRMANSAVLLDNDHDYTAAVSAYEQACRLLGEVMDNSSSDEDRRKLTAIQETYNHRVQELQQLQHADADDLLDNGTDHIRASLDEAFSMDDPVLIETATTTHIVDPEPGPPASDPLHFGNATAKQPIRAAPVPMPMPLSLKRSMHDETATKAGSRVASPEKAAVKSAVHAKYPYAWLDGADDRKISPRSSPNHSISSVDGVKRKHLRQVTDDTEAEFDAALDAAVEAAYDDGLEPYKLEELEGQHRRLSARLSMIRSPYHTEEDERLLAERQAKIQAVRAKVEERRKDFFNQKVLQSNAESDEEERILDDFTSTVSAPDRKAQATSIAPRESDSSGFSGRTGTWGSSVASSMMTTGTTLSPVDEASPNVMHRKQKSLLIPPPAPPPTSALPTVPAPSGIKPPALRLQNPSLQLSPHTGAPPLSPTILERRISGNRAAALTIDTPSNEKRSFLDGAVGRTTQAELTEDRVPPKTAPGAVNTTYLGTDTAKSPFADANKNWAISSPFPSPLPGSSFPQTFEQRPATGGSPITPGLPSGMSLDSSAQGDSPQRTFGYGAPTLPRNASTLSLNKGLSPGGDTLSDASPATPMSFAFGNSLSAFGGRMAPMNTPAQPQNFRQELPPIDNRTRLFDNDMHSPGMPGSPNPEVRNPPKPLEPCPESALLRPFWLMRCFYQTLAHPRGGYISTKLFIPRDVWKTKNVKLKSLEEKISNCDLLTAALLKLAAVDTYDADAILEEMQAFENVLDQAQMNLSKKLGNEVGVHNISSLFKDAPEFTSSTSTDGGGRQGSGENSNNGGSGQTKSGSSKDKNTGSKSYMSSWRKLRNKSSAAGLGSTFAASRENGGVLTMESIPMTTTSTVVRGPWKHHAYADVKIDGPNAGYMGSLMRLCDAVQILDHIARQVEDPGLRHSSPTHVGLELCTRHGAEFFGFYICRFILQDVIMLADKFVKRASEWVLT